MVYPNIQWQDYLFYKEINPYGGRTKAHWRETKKDFCGESVNTTSNKLLIWTSLWAKVDEIP